MTCEEFHSYLSERNALGDLAAAEHVERCPECRQLSSTRQDLIHCLREVRDSAPSTSQSLDASVMHAYRREKGSAASPKLGMARRFVWVPIAVILIVVAALWITRVVKRPITAPSTATVEAPGQVQAIKEEQKVAEAPPAPKAVRPRSHAARRATTSAPTTVASAEQTPASDFRSLMYCDPISCSGAMQVIRIQVPTMGMEPFPTARPSRGLVQADVVVGPDGVARAIRFVR